MKKEQSKTPAAVSPELERIAKEAAEKIYNWHYDFQRPRQDDIQRIIESALSALALQVEKEKKSLGSETPPPLGLTSEETGIAWGSWVQGEWDDSGDRIALVQLAGLFGWIPAERCGPNVWHKKGIGFEITEDLPERIDRERRVPPLQPTSYE